MGGTVALVEDEAPVLPAFENEEDGGFATDSISTVTAATAAASGVSAIPVPCVRSGFAKTLSRARAKGTDDRTRSRVLNEFDDRLSLC